MKIGKDLLHPEQMRNLRSLGVTSKASMVYIVRDSMGDIVDDGDIFWDTLDSYNNMVNVTSIVGDSEGTTGFIELCDIDGDYDHSCSESNGLYTIGDLIRMLPTHLYNSEGTQEFLLNILLHKKSIGYGNLYKSNKEVILQDAWYEEDGFIDSLYRLLIKVIEFRKSNNENYLGITSDRSVG